MCRLSSRVLKKPLFRGFPVETLSNVGHKRSQRAAPCGVSNFDAPFLFFYLVLKMLRPLGAYTAPASIGGDADNLAIRSKL